VKIRVYLDFEADESYTPTKMVFLAGMGGNDLVEFASWEGEGPCGWVDIPLEGVGGRTSSNKSFSAARRRRRRTRRRTNTMTRRQTGGLSSKRKSVVMVDAAPLTEESDNDEWNGNGYDDDHHQQDNIIIDEDDHDYSEDDDDEDDNDDDPSDPYTGNVLKAMVLQMRICENHQNGKDTHVRGFQVFAQDDDRRRVIAAAAAAQRRQSSVRKSLRGVGVSGLAKDSHDEHIDHTDDAAALFGEKGFVGLEEPDWMGDPVIR
jgi:anaphase-promoting complex subunit 10